jgi:O-antigen/teichoic acid export membrane protein
VGPPVVVFLLASLIAPGGILTVFRPEFVEAGATPLRLLALATAFSVVFALAPTQLKFQKRNRTIYLATALAAAAQLGLLLLLIPPLGATGAALAYTLSTVGMYGALAALARREATGASELRGGRLEAASRTPPRRRPPTGRGGLR